MNIIYLDLFEVVQLLKNAWIAWEFVSSTAPKSGASGRCASSVVGPQPTAPSLKDGGERHRGAGKQGRERPFGGVSSRFGPFKG